MVIGGIWTLKMSWGSRSEKYIAIKKKERILFFLIAGQHIIYDIHC